MSAYQNYIRFEDLVSPKYPGVNNDIQYIEWYSSDFKKEWY